VARYVSPFRAAIIPTVDQISNSPFSFLSSTRPVGKPPRQRRVPNSWVFFSPPRFWAPLGFPHLLRDCGHGPDRDLGPGGMVGHKWTSPTPGRGAIPHASQAASVPSVHLPRELLNDARAPLAPGDSES